MNSHTAHLRRKTGRIKPTRQITFDFIDVQRDALVWQAVSTSGYKENQTPDAKELKLLKIVEKALSKYPPKVK